MENKTLTAVNWLYDKLLEHNFNLEYDLTNIKTFKKRRKEYLEQAKQIEYQEQINLLKFSREMCTPEAPVEYVIKEFKKINKQ